MLHPLNRFAAWVFLSGTLLVLTAAVARGENAKRPGTIRVAIYADEGASRKDPSQVTQCLPGSLGYDVSKLSAEQIRRGELEQFDVLIHPGGSGSKQAATLGDAGRLRVRQFVRDGGGFVGICAGAYLASAEYPWALGLLDARVIDDEHWARGQGDVRLRLPPSGRDALGADEEFATIHFENGPLLGPADKDDIPNYESLAAFETEVAQNGAPAGVMKGTTAIARGQFGQGRVVCFSPHPEKTPGLESFLRESVRWAAQSQTAGESKPTPNP